MWCISLCAPIGTGTRVETRDQDAKRQRVLHSQRVGLGHRVQCLGGGRESEGQVPASKHVLQDIHEARSHPRYHPLGHPH